MPFTVEVAFTGLGLVVIRADKLRSPEPSGAELLLVKSPNSHHQHVPKVSFDLSDVKDPINDDVREARVDADGTYVVEKQIDGLDTVIEVDGEPANFEAIWAAQETASGPGPDAPEDALDWLPDAAGHFNMNVVLPGASLAGSPYAARIKLPAGSLSTRRLFLLRPGQPESWVFAGRQGVALAEQLVWSRKGVRSITLPLDRQFVLDEADLVLRGSDPIVRIAVTNLPAVARIGRSRVPDHFRFLSPISGRSVGAANFDVRRHSGGPVTTGGACPPVRSEVFP